MVLLLEKNQLFNKDNFYSMKDAGLLFASNNEKRIADAREKEDSYAAITLSDKMIVLLSLMTSLDEKRALNYINA